MSLKIGEPTTRNFRPFKSSGLRISCFELLISRAPFSPQASGTTPRLLMMANRSLPTSPLVSASKALSSGTRKGSRNRFSSLTCGAQLMTDATLKSSVPWRSAVNSRVVSPPTSDEPGCHFTVMRPCVLSLTSLAQVSAPRPSGKALFTLVDRRYSGL